MGRLRYASEGGYLSENSRARLVPNRGALTVMMEDVLAHNRRLKEQARGGTTCKRAQAQRTRRAHREGTLVSAPQRLRPWGSPLSIGDAAFASGDGV